jgi:hypothetical protein
MKQYAIEYSRTVGFAPHYIAPLDRSEAIDEVIRLWEAGHDVLRIMGHADAQPLTLAEVKAIKTARELNIRAVRSAGQSYSGSVADW